MMDSKERDKALETTMTLIKRRFGDGSIMKLGESTSLSLIHI